MELTVRRNDLLQELHLLQGIVERRNTIPVLANVLLEAHDGPAMDLLATDLEIGLRSQCVATVVRAGAVTVPARRLHDIVRALPDSEIRITTATDGAARITADAFESWLQTMPSDDFPTVPAVSREARSVTLPAAGFRDMVARTRFAVTGDDPRYFLNGALLTLEPGRMQLVATDGSRLALASASREVDAASPRPAALRAILPKKALQELARLPIEHDEEIRYSQAGNHLVFEVRGRQLVSTRIDAEFPAYERVIPSRHDVRVEVDREHLTAAVERVALLSTDRTQAVRLRVHEDGVDVTASHSDVGGARETVPAEATGGQIEVAFNGRYLLDFLKTAGTTRIELLLTDQHGAAVMKPVDGAPGRGDYTYIIMPMRL